MLFAPVLSGNRFDALKAHARCLSSDVGELRDLEVALSDLLGPELAKDPQNPGYLKLHANLLNRTEQVRGKLGRQLRSVKTHSLVIDLAEFASTRGWLNRTDEVQSKRLAEYLPIYAAGSLERSYAKVCKLGRKIDSLCIEDRHELRKRLKKLRYASEFLKDVCSSDEDGLDPIVFIKAIKKLQTILGRLNDAAMIEELFDRDSALVGTDLEAALAAGRLIGVYQQRSDHAWLDAQMRWDAFASIRPFWRANNQKKQSKAVLEKSESLRRCLKSKISTR